MSNPRSDDSETTQLAIPKLSLVVLIGVSGSGKSTFARRHFLPTEIVSSDHCRGMVADDENALDANDDAFALVHAIVRTRLRRGLLTVIDATNVKERARKPLVELAREHHVLPVAIVLDVPEREAIRRTLARPDRPFGAPVIQRQQRDLRHSLRRLEREGFRTVHVLRSVVEIEACTVTRQPLWVDRRDENGPFDIIGDVHGCFDELVTLLDRLGYRVQQEGARFNVTPPDGRRVIFLGDLVDRGPASNHVLRLVMDMVEAGAAFAVPGNHDDKLLRHLQGRRVQVAHGLQSTLDQLANEPDGFRERVRAFLDGLVSHYVLDEGRLVVAHAGMIEPYQGRASRTVRDFALYGDASGETEDGGFPVRRDWARGYRGKATVVYGHTVVDRAEWVNETINIDTGCVLGGELTALRYPERELISVPARRAYWEDSRRRSDLDLHDRSAQQKHDDLLDVGDVLGRRVIETSLMPVTVPEEHAFAALEVMSRFAIDPRWLIYLPPTMSPVETSAIPDLVEHPAEAFAYYRARGVERVVCQEKHMGSRAIVVINRDAPGARQRFGVMDGSVGAVYTRNGRSFFRDGELERAFIDRIRGAVVEAGLWECFETSWLCLDCEVLPWSLKAEELVREQYAPVGAAATESLAAARRLLERASDRGVPGADDRAARLIDREDQIARYRDAYRRYHWDVSGIDDVRVAPFHVLSSERGASLDRDHGWHMEIASRLANAAPGFCIGTEHRIVELASAEQVAAATEWWDALTAQGGEGMVVKPFESVIRDGKGRLVQPALKVRGREYLRIIYGPEYTLPEHLARLRERSVSRKRAGAVRAFALGHEALARFIRREPLRRVHECVFAILALEAEPLDPRL